MSSKRRLRRKSCSGKRAYDSSAEGMTAMMNLKRNTGDTSWFNVYRCRFCKRYHIGHAPRR